MHIGLLIIAQCQEITEALSLRSQNHRNTMEHELLYTFNKLTQIKNNLTLWQTYIITTSRSGKHKFAQFQKHKGNINRDLFIQPERELLK